MTRVDPTRVLVVPGTTEIGLEVLRSLRGCRGVSVYGAGVDEDLGHDSGYLDYAYLPLSKSHDFLSSLSSICDRWSIDYVYPAHDDVIFDLRNKRLITGSVIINHPQETVWMCRSKLRTYRHLAELCSVPTVFHSPREIERYPIFLKPSIGQGSFGARRIDSLEDLEMQIRSSGIGDSAFFSMYAITEFLPGEEVTVDCFSTKASGLLFCASRLRVATSSGISVHTKSVEDEELLRLAYRIAGKFEFDGAWFYQAKRDSVGRFRITEVAPRLAGSSGLRRAQGVNLAHLTLLNAMGRTLSILHQQGATRSRRTLTEMFFGAPEFTAIYVDYDDTLIVDGTLHAELAGFLFAAHSLGIRIELITRHSGDIETELTERGLRSLFDRVTHILDGSPKSNYILNQGGALFIDDSFKERQGASRVVGTLALDTSALPGLWGFLRELQ